MRGTIRYGPRAVRSEQRPEPAAMDERRAIKVLLKP